jgi:hypothetical protein
MLLAKPACTAVAVSHCGGHGGGLHVHRCFLHVPMPMLPRPMKPTIGGATMLPVGDELQV